MRFAAIDIGTNSVKLLVADRKPSGLREVLTRVAVTRLGQGMGRQKKLRLDAMERTLAAIAEFRLADGIRIEIEIETPGSSFCAVNTKSVCCCAS